MYIQKTTSPLKINMYKNNQFWLPTLQIFLLLLLITTFKFFPIKIMVAKENILSELLIFIEVKYRKISLFGCFFFWLLSFGRWWRETWSTLSFTCAHTKCHLIHAVLIKISQVDLSYKFKHVRPKGGSIYV